MKITEVRIGNIVGVDALNVIPPNFISGIKPVILGEIRKQDFEPICYLCGVPLTEERLLKFGFKKQGDGSFVIPFKINYRTENDTQYLVCLFHSNNHFCTLIQDFPYQNDTKHFNYLKMNDIKYVHELQNLCFALTGEELILS